MKVFYYINQLQFSNVRRTALSYNLLYFCLPAGCFMEVCVIIILHLLPPPSCESSGLWWGMSSFKPGWLCGSSLDNAQGVFVRVNEDGWAVFDVIPVPIVCSTGVLGIRGVGFGFGVEVSGAALRMGWVGWGCWCFEFSEESSLSQGDSTRSVNSDTVLMVRECFNDLTCCVPSADCWSLYCHYLLLFKGI